MLDESEVSFFIHIDAKFDDAIFKKAVGERKNVVFIEPRIKTNWGGFSIVKATLALLSEARSFEPPFQRFCLLSGSDFPIKRNSQIRAAFASPQEFIRVDRKLSAPERNTHSRNVEFYWFMDSWSVIKNTLSGRLKRQPYAVINLYHGANWWALTRDCIDYVFQFLASNSRYYSFFKFTLCSDEIFFHSIVKHSPFAAQISHDFETIADLREFHSANVHGGHYIDWNAKTTTLPKVLDLDDFNRLRDTKALFARKFDEEKSGQLVDRLEDLLTR